MPQKEKLILLSDLWGHPGNSWLAEYITLLQAHFQIQNLDSCELAQMPATALSEAERHQYFVQEGIDLAVQQLTNLLKTPTAILAFSIGGTIAWKAGLQGAPITKLYAASATRLRYETQKPHFPIQLAYGALDPYRPKQEWLATMGLKAKHFAASKHDFYAYNASISNIVQDFQNF